MNDYERIAAVIRYLDAHHAEQPDLTRLARQAGLSPYHFHRLFSRWAGVTPKDFLQCLTLAHAKSLLSDGATVLDAALGAGLSGPGRLHDLTVTLEAATPGDMKSGGAGWTIEYGHAATPFGDCLIAQGPRGICRIAFIDGASKGNEREALECDWPRARYKRDNATARHLADRIFEHNAAIDDGTPLRTFVKGTAFQVRVWRALIEVPPGALVTYGALAAALGAPLAARAVGTAVGSNPLACLIPCHRVIRATGMIGGYRWGATRKRAILAREYAGARNAQVAGDVIMRTRSSGTG
jgi:AraC family transcriptional regulator of adaptative response/methylated-DNA-[protein]-cysteine methyltransferase